MRPQINRLETKLRIIERARDLFLKLGVRSVSMDDIASQLGISKKTLYLHVSDKDDLVSEVLRHQITQMQSETRQCCDEAANAVDEVFKTMHMVLKQFRNMNPVVVFDLHKYHYNAWLEFNKYKNEFLLDMITSNLHRGVKEGYYRSDINIAVLAKFRLEASMIPFNMEVFPPSSFNVASVTVTIIENFLYGVSTEKGFKQIEAYKIDKNLQWQSI